MVPWLRRLHLFLVIITVVICGFRASSVVLIGLLVMTLVALLGLELLL